MTMVQNELTAERLSEGDQYAVPDSKAIVKIISVSKKQVEYVVEDPDNPSLKPENQKLKMKQFLEMMNRPSGTKAPADPPPPPPKKDSRPASETELAKVFNEMCKLVDQKRKKEDDFAKAKKKHAGELAALDKRINDFLKIGRDKVIQGTLPGIAE